LTAAPAVAPTVTMAVTNSTIRCHSPSPILPNRW
jgi:hypothetical protein